MRFARRSWLWGVLLLAVVGGCRPRISPPSVPPRAGPDAIYFVLVDRFANGDPSNDAQIDPADPAAFHGGDLQGVLDHLDQLQAMGVRTLWLSPVFKMRTEKFFGHGAFHGYWTYDLLEVEPRFGTKALLRTLSDELHRRGMRLLLDLVVNHLGPDAPLAQERPHWFHRQGALEDWDDPQQLTFRDVHGLPDLAQEQEEVYRFLLEASLGWMRQVGPDGFRLDAVKHVPLPFWARFNSDLRKKGSGLYLLGEMLEGDPAVLARVGREGKFDAMFDFPLAFALVDVFCKDQPPSRIASVLANDRLYPDPDSLVTLLDNHDLPRVMSQCGHDEERVQKALVALLTARGTPSLLYGTEAGLAGSQEPENRGDMRFGANPRLQATIAKFLQLRQRHPSLSEGVPMPLQLSARVFAYARVTPDEAALILINRGQEEVELALPRELRAARWAELQGNPLDPARLTVAPGEIRVALGAPARAGAFGPLHAKAQRLRSGELLRQVDFELPAGSLPPGGTVYAVGSAAELGGWNPQEGLGPLSLGAPTRLSLPVGTVLEFKLVERGPGGQLRWENGDNRVLFVEEGEGPLRHLLAARAGAIQPGQETPP